jgi:predicted HicB family RNase H-like nuclease
MAPKNNMLVQTRVPKKVHDTIKKRADVEGISLADYVRRLLIKEAGDEK